MATHCSILAWRIPWTEEPGGPQSVAHRESDTTEVRARRQGEEPLYGKGRYHWVSPTLEKVHEMAVARPTGELQNQSLNQVDLKELILSMEEQMQTVLSQTSWDQSRQPPRIQVPTLG